ncbi:MAG: family 78 glycoside hydrolase catalytic domain, partial [Planctomycetales bacterium]|nr:family 78 glycoside hydrolase catalytic domain [Planctomycetales bacterium]
WIGYDAQRRLNSDPPAAPLHGARWICLPDDAGARAPAETRVFLGVWDLPADLKTKSARLTLCADDRSQVLLNGEQVARTVDTFQPVTEEVAAYMRPGRNTVRVMVQNNGVGYTGLCLKLEVKSTGDQDFVLVTDDRWFALPTSEQPWQIRSFEGAPHAHVVGPFGVRPWGFPAVRRDLSAPPSYLRGEFTIPAPVKRATAYLAALGWADLSLNGKLVNTDYFSSGWTDYRKRVYYRAYDVTDTVRQGQNVWGALLADGWYAGHIGWGTQRDAYGKRPRVRSMLRVEYKDGRVETFSTNGGWSVTRGPVKLADVLVGEEYDATGESSGWNEPGGDAVRLAGVDVGAEVQPVIQWHPGPPVVEVEEFPARSVSEPKPGVFVFDIGQNIAGVARIKVRGESGQRVQVRYAERLNPDGTLYTDNLRLARAVDFYTCKSPDEETWQPRQTFHGFQYVELTGLAEPPAAGAVTGVALSSDTPIASQFECSDPNLERLYKNVLWTQRANFIDVPTDCPQR